MIDLTEFIPFLAAGAIYIIALVVLNIRKPRSG
jgi:hypothetical protein